MPSGNLREAFSNSFLLFHSKPGRRHAGFSEIVLIKETTLTAAASAFQLLPFPTRSR
jgi:hypothetical protein